MAKEKPGVMIYWSMFDVLESLMDGQAKTMLQAIRNYSQNGELPNFGSDTVLATLWMLVKPQIDADHERYERIREKRRLAGLASAAKRATEDNECQQVSTSADKCEQNQPITIPITNTIPVPIPDTVPDKGIRDKEERDKGCTSASPSTQNQDQADNYFYQRALAAGWFDEEGESNGI